MKEKSLIKSIEVSKGSRFGYVKSLLFFIFMSALIFVFSFFARFKSNVKQNEIQSYKNTENIKNEEFQEDFGLFLEEEETPINLKELNENSRIFGTHQVKATENKNDNLKTNSQKFVMPVSGRIIKNFSIDDLVYSKTLDDWRTHGALDIEGVVGTPVKAFKDGTVSSVYQTEEMGVSVVLEHAGGLKSVYSNLQDIDFIAPGKKVNSGDIIGGIGDGALCECKDSPHLHFEVIKNGAPINPKDLIK